MNKEKLVEACNIIEKVIIEVSEMYNSKETTEYQKALLETMIGAAIWYLPSSNELYSGYISIKAIEAVKNGMPISQLTQEHKFPRKQAGKLLLKEKYNLFIEKNASLCDLYLKEFGLFNYVVKSENRELIKFQKDDTHAEAYKNAGIETNKMSIEEIKSLLPPRIRYSRKPKIGNETHLNVNQETLPDSSLILLETQIPETETNEEQVQLVDHEDTRFINISASIGDKSLLKQMKDVPYSKNETQLRNGLGSESTSTKMPSFASPRDFGIIPTDRSVKMKIPQPSDKFAQVPSKNINENGVDLTGIAINNKHLQIEKPNTAQCYKAFMNFCIENFSDILLNLKYSGICFSLDSNDPKFGSAIKYKKIIAYNGFYYHTHLGSKSIIRIIEKISEELELHVDFIYK